MSRSDLPVEYTPRHQAVPRRHRGRVALFVSLAVVLIVAVAAGGYVYSLMNTFNTKTQTLDAGIAGRPIEEIDGPRNILLLGTDSRGEGNDVADVKGEDGQRSDTMMIVHIPEDREDVYVMSMVRDLWVEIPGHGERKVNAALNLGGYPLVVETMEELVGVRIDNVVSVDFEGFSSLTEALGGVTLDNPNEFCTGHANPTCFEEGEIHLEGNDALRFVRERKAFLEGDFQRVANQQLFIKAVMRGFLNAETLSNPVRIYDIVDKFSGYLTVDETLDSSAMAGLVGSIKNIRTNDVHFFTIPTGPGSKIGNAEIITQDPEAMEALRLALTEDDLEGFLANNSWTNAYGNPITGGHSDADASETPPSEAPAQDGTGVGE
ncbi:LCP family protein [Zhihengliuella halotolerans]|uniref:LCP family protein n=1 Tax=Zhihengliuella halotolerans TaxID=370736 RepID=UPI0011AEE233|nr:LCP family protein [Zhihengliuella halotolerans]